MAIAYVQAPAAATVFSGTTIALAFGSNVTAGSMLCAHVYGNHGISGIADSRSQTYTSAVNVTDGATFSAATLGLAGWVLGSGPPLAWLPPRGLPMQTQGHPQRMTLLSTSSTNNYGT